MAEIEGHAQRWVVDLVCDPEANFELGGPKTGMRIKRDLHALGLGVSQQLAQLRYHDRIAVFGREWHAHGKLHLVEAKPQRAARARQSVDRLDKLGREFCLTISEIGDVVAVKKDEALALQRRGVRLGCGRAAA